MRRLLLFCSLCAWNCCAQGTYEFQVFLSGANVVPPNQTIARGYGRLDLNDSALSCLIYADLGLFGGRIYGPAPPGMNGPPVFGDSTLIQGICEPPQFGNYCVFQGSYSINEQQRLEVLSGLWYVQFSGSAGPVRGQIVPVPEPPGGWLLGIGAGLLLFVRKNFVK